MVGVAIFVVDNGFVISAFFVVTVCSVTISGSLLVDLCSIVMLLV